MSTYTVIYVIDSDGIQWQFFECQAWDSDHAEELCTADCPKAYVLWVNSGLCRTMD